MFRLRIVKGAEHAEGVQAEARLPDVLTRFTVGRDPANHWPIPDRTLALSARHCGGWPSWRKTVGARLSS